MMNRLLLLFLPCFAVCSLAQSQVQPEVFVLDNGMKFILLPRLEEPNNIAAGWVAQVGSVNERPGITGLSHFFEHLMFKGTKTIGTSDSVKDASYTNKERDLRNSMLDIIWTEQYDRFKRGEIDDPWDASYDTEELSTLRESLRNTMDEHRSVIIKDEISSIYQGEGAVGLNAFTSEDVTFYINQLPANKLELWCWVESDRLANSVFREFFSERDVVHEERRMRTESTPTGEFQEQFNSMFWQASPYSWPVIGWPSDLNSYTLEEAKRYFDIYYQPSNLIGVLVGDFDVKTATAMIKKYFGQLRAGSSPPPPVPTIEPSQKASQRMVAEVDAQSQIEIRYHAVPFGHADSYALDILSAVLNGKTGRLYKSMVEGEEIATSASFYLDGKKYAGFLSFSAIVKGDATPENLEESWYEQVSILQNELVSEKELKKVKNNVIADQYRQLQSNFYLMIQLGYLEALGGWEYINDSGKKLLEVTPEDVMRVAKKYLTTNNSSVVIYNRLLGSEPVDEELMGFGPQEQAMIRAALLDLDTMSAEDLLDSRQQMRSQIKQIPAEMLPVFEYLLKKLEERCNELVGEEAVDVVEEEIVEDVVEEDNIPEVVPEAELVKPGIIQLDPQQLAQATEFLENLYGKPLGDLVQIHAALQGAMTAVPDDERVILEYIIQKLSVHIAELEK
ncbi:MAG: pitrilysin family protein [Phycisphaerales bacterium]|jgi:predicted Zn-dependent peptidase|nr:pitrilysin family protein [Phycisphaerales bacterium]